MVLRVYVSAACLGCATARQLVVELRRVRPHYPIELIDLDLPGAVRPPQVFGTPTYCLGERIVSLGNPRLADLLQLIDAGTTGSGV